MSNRNLMLKNLATNLISDNSSEASKNELKLTFSGHPALVRTISKTWFQPRRFAPLSRHIPEMEIWIFFPSRGIIAGVLQLTGIFPTLSTPLDKVNQPAATAAAASIRPPVVTPRWGREARRLTHIIRAECCYLWKPHPRSALGVALGRMHREKRCSN